MSSRRSSLENDVNGGDDYVIVMGDLNAVVGAESEEDVTADMDWEKETNGVRCWWNSVRETTCAAQTHGTGSRSEEYTLRKHLEI